MQRRWFQSIQNDDMISPHLLLERRSAHTVHHIHRRIRMAGKQIFEKVVPPAYQQDPDRWSVRQYSGSPVVDAQIVIDLEDGFGHAVDSARVGKDQTLAFAG